jgi:polar amino acid transport system substrate-binding protein
MTMRNTSKLSYLGLSVLAALAQTTAASAEGAKASVGLPETIVAAKQLVVGVNCSYPPAGYVGLDGKPAGYEIAITSRISEFAAQEKVALQTQCVNDANRIPFLQSNKVDLILAGLAWAPARAEQIEFSNPIWVSNLQLVVPKASPIKDYADLAGKKVVTTTGALYQSWIQKCYPQAQLMTAQSPSDASTMLTQGRVDAFAYIDVYGFNFVRNNPAYKIVADLASPAIQGIGVKKGNTALLAWINDVVEQLRKKDALYQSFANEVKDPEFSAKYRKLVPGPDIELKYGAAQYLDCNIQK